MANYKVIFEGEEDQDVFSTYEEAEQHALELSSCYHAGGETLELSNPGDNPYDPDIEPNYEIIETNEPMQELDEATRMFINVVNSQGVFNEEGEYVRCPICDRGLHYYNGVITCPECGPVNN